MTDKPAAPLRILHVTTTMDRGGAENHIHDLILGQLASGRATIACAYLKGDGYWAESLERRGVEVVALGMRHYGAPAPFFRFRRLIRRFNPDIVHVHGAPAELYALAAKTMLGKRPRLIITRHELRFRLFNLPGYSTLDRLLTRAADRVVAVSDAVLQADIARSRPLIAKSEVIHHGFDPAFSAEVSTEDVARVRTAWGVSDDELLIGTVARLSPEKSLDTLLRAFAAYLASAQSPASARLVLVGRGPLESELRGLADALDISSRVIWAGFRDDMAEVFAALDIFAFTSVLEGFGMVLLEAMAASKPIIAADIYAPPTILGRDNVLLFPPGDAEALALAIARLAEAPDMRKRLGEAGRERLRRDFTLQAMFDRTLAVYDRALGSAA